jgi:hypothetical protein
MALITTAQLADLTPFFGDGEEKIKKAELAISNTQRELLPVLCKATYDELVSLQESGYLSGVWQELYDIIEPWLAWASFASYLPFAQHTDTDAGMRTFSEDNSVVTPQAQLSGIIEQSLGYAESYKSEIYSFLVENKASFPDWASSRCYNCSSPEVKMRIGGSGRKRYYRKLLRKT